MYEQAYKFFLTIFERLKIEVIVTLATLYLLAIFFAPDSLRLFVESKRPPFIDSEWFYYIVVGIFVLAIFFILKRVCRSLKRFFAGRKHQYELNKKYDEIFNNLESLTQQEWQIIDRLYYNHDMASPEHFSHSQIILIKRLENMGIIKYNYLTNSYSITRYAYGFIANTLDRANKP
ncbi:hypothetical protein KRX11_10270 [Pasteurellaceae bacterium TAE3-ERU1]|nr:hypothetical protein [Pasteurellaceae bacterium TAE3-ERU1]